MTSDKELLEALAALDVDARFDAIRTMLATIAPEHAAELANAWAVADASDVKSVGLDVLGVLCNQHREYLPGLLDEVERAATNTDADVRWSAVAAIKDKNDSSLRQWNHRIRTVLLSLASDADSDVRFQAVASLPIYAEDATLSDPVVAAILQATDDPDPTIRDWAVFGLGVQLDFDASIVRDVLFRHLDEAEGDTAGEAAVGLARRGDPRVYEVIAARLAAEDVGNLWVEAAAELGDVRLVPLLEALQVGGWQADEPRPIVLDEALTRCRGNLGPSLVAAVCPAT